MVKFLLPKLPTGRVEPKSYRGGNHVGDAKRHSAQGAHAESYKLNQIDPVKFDEKPTRIRINFTQNPAFIANDSFKAVCYGLVQRRRKGRRG